jgi:tetratricopeptide (TPR) repeat protein
MPATFRDGPRRQNCTQQRDFETVIRHICFIRTRATFQFSRWHLGLFSFYTHVEGQRFSGLAIRLRGLLLWSLGGLVFGYLGAVSALFLVWNRNPSLGLGYGEMLLLPSHWDSIRERRAKASVDAGIQAMKDSRWADGEMLIRSGLQKTPSILAGRSQLAYFYLVTGRWWLGAPLLASGFSLRYPGRPYIEEAFAVAQVADDLELCTDWSKQLLSRFGESMPPDDRSWLLLREARFLFAQEKYQEVADVAGSHADQDSAGLRELQVLALLKLGDCTKALAKLEFWRRWHPEDTVLIACIQAQALRRAGRLDDMELNLDRACAMASWEPTVLLFSVTERFEAGNRESAGGALELYLRRFGQPSSRVEAAMASLAEVKDAEGMDRLLRFAVEEKLPLKQMVLSKALFHLTEAEIDQSRKLFQELDKLWDLENPRDRLLRDFFKLLLEAAADSSIETRLRFENFCDERRLEWGDSLRAARVLARFNREKTALRVLDIALERNPSSYHLSALRNKIQAGMDTKTVKTE